jgi:serine/threonine protein kinase
MGLIPLKVSQAAEVLVETAKIGRSSSKNMPSHRLVEGKKERVEKYLPRIKEACVEIMKKEILNPSPGVLAVSSEIEGRYRIIGQRSCRRHTIRGVLRDIVQDQIVPIIDGIAAESTCLIFLAESAQDCAEDIVLEGPWRAVAIADYLLRAATKDVTSLPPSVDSTAELQEGNKIQAKIQSGLLRVSDVQTTDDWEGTIQANEPDQKASVRRIGGKCALAGKISESALRESGLRWWIPPKHGPSRSGSIKDMFLIRSDPSQQLDALSRLTKAFVGQSKTFPLLTSRLVRAPNGGGDRAVAVSIQRWPSEKVSNKELELSKKSKGKRMQIGFSAAALQEMQLLRQLHGLIPSPQGHPNFILPVGIAVPGNEDLMNASPAPGGSLGLLSMDDPLFSLFRSSEENERAAEREKKVKSGPHLVFHPTPYVLQRFMSRRTQKSEDFSIRPATILASWFHDLLSALVHCHSNHVVLKNLQPDQILVDHSGVAKLGGLYRVTVLPPDERRKSIKPLRAARSSKVKKEDAEDDYSNNPYAAPEILLGCPKFSKESDIWAMGCLLATLVLNKPLFVGKDRTTLLTSQFKIVGHPGKGNYEDALEYPYYKAPEKKSKKYRRNVEKALEHMLKEDHSQYAKVIDLLARMLHLDPQKRCTAAEALGHDFLTEYVENCNSEAFRESYVSDWMALKETLLRMGDSDKEKERTRKRKVLMLAATKTSNDDDGDDLYDMDDILGDEQADKKQKIGTLQ